MLAISMMGLLFEVAHKLSTSVMCHVLGSSSLEYATRQVILDLGGGIQSLLLAVYSEKSDVLIRRCVRLRPRLCMLRKCEWAQEDWEVARASTTACSSQVCTKYQRSE